MKPDAQAARIAVNAKPNDCMLRVNLARVLMEAAWYEAETDWKANYSEATKILESVLAVEPHNAVALVNLGVAFSDQGLHARALECYRRAEALDWLDGNLQFNIGVALVNLEEEVIGNACFQKATIQPQQPNTSRAYFDPQAH
jgi:tetratricopeptide (TPR) repeat protein